MDIVSNSFEKKWFFLFLFLYVFIMIPFPWYFNDNYVASFYGVPLFIYSWIGHNIVVVICIALFAHYSKQNKFYQQIESYLNSDQGAKNE